MSPEEAKAGIAAAKQLDDNIAKMMSVVATTGCRQDLIDSVVAAGRLVGGSAADHEAVGYLAFVSGLHEYSHKHYLAAARLAPDDPVVWYNLASSQRNLGLLDEAERSCSCALTLAPIYPQAALLRSQLHTQTAETAHIDNLLQTLRVVPVESTEAIFIHYALGKEFDDLGEYDKAWQHFASGAAVRRRSLQYAVEMDLAKLSRIQTVFNPTLLDKLGDRPPLTRYGFIIGLPRSGTTLVERVLTSAAGVSSNGETDNLLGALMDGTPAEGRDIFERVARAEPGKVQASYARRAGAPSSGEVVLEKLPMNYLYAGAIARTLPDAQILMLERNLIDNCLGMFSTLFGTGYPFSYNLDELGQYVIAYAKLARHWSEVLGKRLLRLSYDDFVADPANLGPQIAAHFGLTWSEDLLRVEANSAATATASAVQVRRPIYRSSSGRWKNYERPLQPLADALAKSGLV